jgi:hypothetical protein
MGTTNGSPLSVVQNTITKNYGDGLRVDSEWIRSGLEMD